MKNKPTFRPAQAEPVSYEPDQERCLIITHALLAGVEPETILNSPEEAIHEFFKKVAKISEISESYF